MPQIVLPNLLVDGTDTAIGSEVYGNDKAITDTVNGQLASDNLASNANIKGSQLSSADPIPTVKIQDDAVDASKLRDADDAGDANRAVTGNHIRKLAVDKTKLSTTPGSKVTAAQIEMSALSDTLPFTSNVGTLTGLTVGTGADRFGAISLVPVNVAGNWQLKMQGWLARPSGNTIYVFDSTIDPSLLAGIGVLPVASNRILSAWLQAPVTNVSNQISGTVLVHVLKLT